MNGSRFGRLRPSALALAVGFAAASVVSLARPAVAGWWDEAGKTREATLDEVASSPELWRDVPVSIVVRFGRTLDAPPALGAAEWTAFSASSRAGNPFTGLVVRRGSAEAARLGTLRDGDELRLRAVVRGGGTTPGSRTIVEVVAISGAADALSTDELALLRRADDMMTKDNGGAAERLVRTVLDAREFAPPIRAELWRRVARAERAQKKLDAAAASFRNALAAAPDDTTSARELADLRDVLASAAARAAKSADTTASATGGGSSPSQSSSKSPLQSPPPADASARTSRPFPVAPVATAPAPAAIPVPIAGARLAPPRDRDGTPAVPPQPKSPVVVLPTPAPQVDELLPPPAPKLAAPK
ncbi:MAG: hypothetical protein K8T90_19170 [Planctomycetes bacterium]|nr:hypothetical protein [Planctomycetota bacterium]